MAGPVRSVQPIGATLGEGPVWHDAGLWFVDIKQQRLYRLDPARDALTQWAAPGEIGWILPRAKGGMIAGLDSGLYAFDSDSGRFTQLFDPEAHLPGNRLNDATTDPQGRIWFGSMDNAEQDATGRLYRADAQGSGDSGLAPVVITNGPAIAPDGGALYHTDTLGRSVWRVVLNDDGTLAAPTLFCEIAPGEGHPDGSTIDAEGCVWVALFGGWGVRRYDPAGRLIEAVRFPVANVTKIAFGGADLRTAYATTARKGLSEDDLRAQPLAGNLFAFDAGVSGLPVYPAQL